ncbi:MAG TPA: hypothetical protein VHX65_12830 [Pirellulales bacterium]|jgi:hypothetical protein|nr:hypothetical protein [Pirellulales bacterium]
MGFEQIEHLKHQYTDQFVVVDDHRPELTRFRGVTGQVKTVNMNGRALVEFQDYAANIGWYDIDLEFLTVVPKPDPAAAAAAAKSAAKGPAEPPGGKAKPAAKAAVAKAAPAAKPVAAKSAAAKPAAGKPSTADILAAARAKKGGEASKAVPAGKADVGVAPEPAAPVNAAAAKPAAKASPSAGSNEKPTTTADKIALCRRIDSKL